jgi:hypothetical protein
MPEPSTTPMSGFLFGRVELRPRKESKGAGSEVAVRRDF